MANATRLLGRDHDTALRFAPGKSIFTKPLCLVHETRASESDACDRGQWWKQAARQISGRIFRIDDGQTRAKSKAEMAGMILPDRRQTRVKLILLGEIIERVCHDERVRQLRTPIRMGDVTRLIDILRREVTRGLDVTLRRMFGANCTRSNFAV